MYASTLDRVLRYLSEADGTLLGQKTIAGSLIAQPSLGQDANGTEMLFLTDMGSSRWRPVFPGFIQALVPTLPPNEGSNLYGTTFYLGVVAVAVTVSLVIVLLVRGRRGAERC